MDEQQGDLAAALRELAGEEAGDLGPHCATKRLIAYRQGTLAAAEREAVQEHLSLCPRCTGLLRELREFEAAAARGDAGPEGPRQEAWEALARRLPARTPPVRPISASPRGAAAAARGRWPRFAAGAVAALLLAALGLTLWAALTVRRQDRRLALLEQGIAERDAALAAARRELAARAPKPGQDAEKEALVRRVAELSAALERRAGAVAAPHRLEVAVSPRFALRGQEAPARLLRGDGAVNALARSPEGRFTAAFELGTHPAYGEYRLELLDRAGKLVWAGRRPAAALVGDAGTSVSLAGLDPGRYRLRIEGLRPDGGKRIAEYLLEVGSS